MGSYDTGESYRPSFGRSEGSSTPSRRRVEPSIDQRVDEPMPSHVAYDRSLKTVVALGGGLTPDRIVYPVPEQIRDGSLTDVVNYLVSDEVAVRTEDKAVRDAVRSRMGTSGYRIIVNGTHNLSSEAMTRPLGSYLLPRDRDVEEGGQVSQVKFNYADVSVVTHDEGGRP